MVDGLLNIGNIDSYIINSYGMPRLLGKMEIALDSKNLG